MDAWACNWLTCAFKSGCLMSLYWLHTSDCKLYNEMSLQLTPDRPWVPPRHHYDFEDAVLLHQSKHYLAQECVLYRALMMIGKSLNELWSLRVVKPKSWPLCKWQARAWTEQKAWLMCTAADDSSVLYNSRSECAARHVLHTNFKTSSWMRAFERLGWTDQCKQHNDWWSVHIHGDKHCTLLKLATFRPLQNLQQWERI